MDERSGVVRTRENSPFQLDLEYVLYVKAEDQNGRLDGRRYQSTPEERLSIVGGKRQPQFYMSTYEAEIPENQKKDSELVYFPIFNHFPRHVSFLMHSSSSTSFFIFIFILFYFFKNLIVFCMFVCCVARNLL